MYVRTYIIIELRVYVYTADGTQLAGCSVCSIWFICCYMCMFVRMPCLGSTVQWESNSIFWTSGGTYRCVLIICMCIQV